MARTIFYRYYILGKWRGLSVENDNIKVYLSENGNIENIKVADQDVNMKQVWEETVYNL